MDYRRELLCHMCFYKAKNIRSLICHCLLKHKNEPGFIAYCTVGNCLYSTRSWNAYKLHFRKKHRNIPIDSHFKNVSIDREHNENYDSDGETIADAELQATYEPDAERRAKSHSIVLAKFFMSLEAEHKASKASIDKIAVSNRHLMSSVLHVSSDKLRQILADMGKDDNDIDTVLNQFNEAVECEVLTKHDNFLTDYSRKKTYQDLCKVVLPESVVMGYRYVRKGRKIIRKREVGYYIPLQKQLEQLLNLPEVWHYFKNPFVSQDDFLRDVNDGSFVKEHVLNADPRNFLKLSLHYDDVEYQNPLRSSQKHKLAMFYFQILNFPVQFRSKLSSIFLYAICYSKNLSKHGPSSILNDFVETVQNLSTRGVIMSINGCENVVKGTLLLSLCDAPAAALIAGFKEGSLALRPCRRCHADKDTRKEKFLASAFRLRDMVSHLDQCREVTDRNSSKSERAYWSKFYGINSLSPLCKITDFNVCSQMLQDPMHLLCEGIICHLMALFLHRCVIEYEFFSLDWLNDQITNYPYSYLDLGHIPELITRNQLVTDVYIKQKAAAMLTLTFCLPHILGHIFPLENEHYRHFIYLVQICQLCFSPYAKKETVSELEQLIDLFGSQWRTLYPLSNVKPKLHFLTHCPEIISKYGSMHGLSCMRFESKHGWFKSQKIRNFKNLPLSLSNKHQLYMCNRMTDISGGPSPNFVYAGDEIGEGHVSLISNFDTDLHEQMCNEFGYEEVFHIYETNRVNIHGNEYKHNCAILYKTDEYGHPTFGVVDRIFVRNEMKYFVLNLLETNCYLWQFHSYLVNNTDMFILVSWSRIKNKFPLQVYRSSEDLKLIMNRFSHYSGF